VQIPSEANAGLFKRFFLLGGYLGYPRAGITRPGASRAGALGAWPGCQHLGRPGFSPASLMAKVSSPGAWGRSSNPERRFQPRARAKSGREAQCRSRQTGRPVTAERAVRDKCGGDSTRPRTAPGDIVPRAKAEAETGIMHQGPWSMTDAATVLSFHQGHEGLSNRNTRIFFAPLFPGAPAFPGPAA
jgi:hypothetical protein